MSDAEVRSAWTRSVPNPVCAKPKKPPHQRCLEPQCLPGNQHHQLPDPDICARRRASGCKAWMAVSVRPETLAEMVHEAEADRGEAPEHDNQA